METLLLDKSAFQALTNEEIRKSRERFQILTPDVLYLELLGNLRYGEERTKALSRKLRCGNFIVNMPLGQICKAELLLGREIPMNGLPLVFAEEARTGVGGLAVAVVETAVDTDLSRWAGGNFSADEFRMAAEWKSAIDQFDLAFFERGVRTQTPKERRPTDLSQVSTLVEATLRDTHAQKGLLDTLLAYLTPYARLSDHEIDAILNRWREAGGPLLSLYAPYSSYCLRILLVLFMGVGSQLLGTRNSNFVDAHYLHYLPFCSIFCSRDNIHTALFPFVSYSQRSYSFDELKEQLAERPGDSSG
jgi:hypothetical protein